MNKKNEFKTVVFAGGGSRCLWQVGFWDVAAPGLKIKPEIVAGVSAGAAMAAMVMAGTSQLGIRLIKEATAANKKNFYFSNIFSKEPAFPHYRIYRDTVVRALGGDAVKKIKSGPEIRVMFSHPPLYLGARSGTIAGMLAYTIEKHTMHPVHPKLASRLGYTATVAKLNDCDTADEMADLVMCSSCTPPFVPVLRHNGRVTLDGGVIDNVPVSAIGSDGSDGKMLVLMTRVYDSKRIPEVPGRVYVYPSSAPPVSKWDYTSPQGLQGAYDLGRRDGEVFLKKVLSTPPS